MADEKPLRRGRLRNKMLVYGILAAVIVQAISSGLFYYLGTQGLRASEADFTNLWVQKSLSIGTSLAYAIQIEGDISNGSKMQGLLNGYIAGHPDVLKANIYAPNTSDPGGYFKVASTEPSNIGKAASQDDADVIQSNQAAHVIKYTNFRGSQVHAIEVIAPVRDDTGAAVGGASAYWSIETLDAQMNTLRNNFLNTLLLATLGIFAISLGVFFVIMAQGSRKLSNPIAQLKKAAEEISMGRFDTHLEVDSNDEIGELAESFQRMATSLKLAARMQEPLETTRRRD